MWGVEVHLYCTITEGSRVIVVMYRHIGEYSYSCIIQVLSRIGVQL